MIGCDEASFICSTNDGPVFLSKGKRFNFYFDILSCYFWFHGFGQRCVWRIDAVDGGKAGRQKGFLVGNGTRKEMARNLERLGMTEDDAGKLAHKCLEVSASFASDDVVGIANQIVEVYGFKKQLCARSSLSA